MDALPETTTTSKRKKIRPGLDIEPPEKLEKLQRVNFRPCEHSFPIEGHFTDFINSNHFFAELWRHVRRVATRDIPFAAMSFDEVDACYVLWWNPDAFASFSKEEIQGILHHEVYHIIFNHISMLRQPRSIWNTAEDLAINSIICDPTKERSTTTLPPFVLIPGRRGQWYDRKERICKPIADHEAELYPLAFLIEKFPLGLSSFEYHTLLQNSGLFKELTPGDIEMLIMADAHPWDDVEDSEQVSEWTRTILAKAVKVADSMNSWGSVPQSMQSLLRHYVNRSVDWKEYLAYFFGTLRAPQRQSTMKRLNKRYPYIHAGTRHSHAARLLIAFDASGSVDNQMLELLFATIRSLNEDVEIDVVQFDCSLDKDSVTTWMAGDNTPTVRERCGGTDFDAPTSLVNDHDNDGRWDGLLICTDGQAGAPGPCNIRRVWVLPKGCEMYFKTDELVIKVNDDQPLM